MALLSKVKGQKDLAAGIIFIVAGASFFLAAQKYQIGTAPRMGPGYFPALLGIVLVLMGIGATIVGIRAKVPSPIPRQKIEPLVLILLSVVSFALLVEHAGLIVASFVCIFFACFRRVFTNPLEVLLIFVGLTAFNIVVFVWTFGMLIPVFWWDR